MNRNNVPLKYNKLCAPGWESYFFVISIMTTISIGIDGDNRSLRIVSLNRKYTALVDNINELELVQV